MGELGDFNGRLRDLGGQLTNHNMRMDTPLLETYSNICSKCKFEHSPDI